MVPKDIRQEPFFFVTEDQNELSNLLIKAIDYVDSEYRHDSHEKISNLHSEVEQSIFLKNQLTSMFNLDKSTSKSFRTLQDWHGEEILASLPKEHSRNL